MTSSAAVTAQLLPAPRCLSLNRECGNLRKLGRNASSEMSSGADTASRVSEATVKLILPRFQMIISVLLLSFAVFLFGQETSSAGFEEGARAWDRGDYATALKEFRPLAEQGNAAAQFNLAQMYKIGLGVAQNYKEALGWYHRAADQGLADAQNNLGAMYANGQGVPQDYKAAIGWYRKAADQGLAEAQFNLGLLYSERRDVPRDYKAAVEW